MADCASGWSALGARSITRKGTGLWIKACGGGPAPPASLAVGIGGGPAMSAPMVSCLAIPIMTLVPRSYLYLQIWTERLCPCRLLTSWRMSLKIRDPPFGPYPPHVDIPQGQKDAPWRSQSVW